MTPERLQAIKAEFGDWMPHSAVGLTLCELIAAVEELQKERDAVAARGLKVRRMNTCKRCGHSWPFQAHGGVETCPNCNEDYP